MASLYNRATPQQARILRAVEGAVKNAADAHPEIQISPRHRRSIAKRAAGTLTAQWPAVLAATGPSGKSAVATTTGDARSAQSARSASRGAENLAIRVPMRRLIRLISQEIGPLKREGRMERAEAFIDVLRMIHELRAA